MARYRSKVSGPRMAGLGAFLRDAALATGVEIDVQHEKGLIREDVYFDVNGTEEQVEHFKDAIAYSIARHNAR